MNLIAMIPEGVTELTVNGLTQWDYGRKLELHGEDLPSVVEVHFSCPSMQDAIVRVGSGASGVATVSIPDLCLEQSAPITAWVYEVGETSGRTIKTLTLNILERKRPQTAPETITPEVSNQYTEAVEAMKDAVEDVKNGKVKSKFAQHADTAGTANQAGSAETITCHMISDLTDLNGAANGGTCALNFTAPVTVQDVTIPRYSMGLLMGGGSDTSLVAISHLGNTYTAFRTGGNWQGARTGDTLHPQTTTYKNSGTKTQGISAPGIYVVTTCQQNTFVLCVTNMSTAVYCARCTMLDDPSVYEWVHYDGKGSVKYEATKNIEGPMGLESFTKIASI
jgi:hypothetical protein